MKKLTILCLSFFLSAHCFGQFAFLRKLPVKPVMDIGFSTYSNPPANMDINLLGSRAVNMAALYEVYISDYFTFNTGLGVSIERYNFAKNVTLRETANAQDSKVVSVVPLAYADLRKTLLTPTYLEIPIEFRAVTSTGRETFRFIVGFKAGILLAAHTKIKYGTGDDVRTEKFKDDFLLNRFRYGIYGRLGYKSIHLYTYYSLSDLFQANKLSPNQAVMPLTFGLSFMMF